MGTQRPILGPVSRSGGGRGHIEERKNGTFRAIVSAGIDPVTGRRRVLKETVPSRKQAKVALTRLLNQVDEQRHPRSTVTLRQVIAMWLEVAEHGRKTRQRFYAQLRRCRDITCGGRLRAGHECKALANSSIRQIHFILRPKLARDAFLFSRPPDLSAALKPDSVTQRYRRLAARNHLRSTRLDSLWHYSATELLAAGVDVRTVAGRLGRGSGGSTTLRFYAARVDEADRRTANTIAGIVPRPDPLRRTPRNPYELLTAELRSAIESGPIACARARAKGGTALKKP